MSARLVGQRVFHVVLGSDGERGDFSDPRLWTAACVYPERREVVLCFNEVLDGGANLCEDAVNDVHDAVGGDLVPVDDPSAVHRDHLGLLGNIKCRGSAPRPPPAACAHEGGWPGPGAE